MFGIRSNQKTDRSNILVICAILLALVFSGTIYGQANQHADFRTQHVVLRNGSVFSGIVERANDQVTVRSQNGVVVKLTRPEVDFITDSIEYAAERIANRIIDNNPRAHVSLANWCLRYGALSAAQREIDWLSARGENQSELRELQRRLDLATTQATPAERNPVVADNTAKRNSDPLGTVTHSKHFLVRQSLQTAVDSLSKDAKRDFTSQVHNRIVNGCAAAQCHGSPAVAMRLWRDEGFTGLESTSTQRNLLAILNQVDRKTPDNSNLLSYMTTAHGGQDEPAFVRDSPDWNEIRNWIKSIVIADEVAMDAPDATASISQTSFQVAPDGAMTTLPVGSALPMPVDLLSKSGKAEVSSDPYDPELFNRTYSSPNIAPPQRFTAPSSSPVAREPAYRSLPPVQQTETEAPVAPTTRNTRPLPPVDDDDG